MRFRAFTWVACCFFMGPFLHGAERLRYEYGPADIGTGRHKECQAAVISAVRGSTTGPVSVKIGGYYNLDWLLERAGVDDYDVAGIMAFLDKQKQLTHPHPVFQRAVSEMKRVGTSAELFVCVLGKECKFYSANIAALHFTSSYVLRENFAVTKPREVPVFLRKPPLSFSHVGLKEQLHAMIVRVPPAMNGKGRSEVEERYGRNARRRLIEEMCHETAHAADSDLFSDWIAANYYLISVKRFDEVDPLFLKLTRERDGQLVVDLALWVTFMEARGYNVSDYVTNHIFAHDRIPHQELWTSDSLFGLPIFNLINGETDYAAMAVRAIYAEGGGWFLRNNKIDSSNIFDFGIKLGRQFEKMRELVKMETWQ